MIECPVILMPLPPRESAQFVVASSTNLVELNGEAVKRVAEEILESVRGGGMSEVDFDAYEMHPKGTDRAAIDWIFLIDTINFSFWTDGDDHFSVTYRNTTHIGYFAGCACINRVLDEGIPITSADYMSTITEEQLAGIFLSDSGVAIPLLKERVEVIREAGRVLMEVWE